MSENRNFAIFCPDGFEPKKQLAAISDGNQARIAVVGTGLDLLALYGEITEALLKNEMPIELLMSSITIAISEARKAGVEIDLEESLRNAMMSLAETEEAEDVDFSELM